MRKFILLSMLFFAQYCNACTWFGVVTQSGIFAGQNLDYYYSFPQKFERMLPIQQFNNWYENNYSHNNSFYALISGNNVQMGVNESGLAVFEENAPFPKNYKKQRKFQQPENGNAEGMIKYGILQNFNSVDEIIPFLSKIFSVAQPDFYQIADDKKILIIEVAYAEHNKASQRKFTYKILEKPKNFYAHTNYYLNPQYVLLNKFRDADFINGAKNRFEIVTGLIRHAKASSIDIAAQWLKNTRSYVSKESDNNWCQNTSLFRSNLQGLKQIIVGNLENETVYGTVSTMIVHNNSAPKKSYLYLMMLDSITTNNQRQQIIKYKELHTSLDKLFTNSKPVFVEHELTRNSPLNKVCS